MDDGALGGEYIRICAFRPWLREIVVHAGHQAIEKLTSLTRDEVFKYMAGLVFMLEYDLPYIQYSKKDDFAAFMRADQASFEVISKVPDEASTYIGEINEGWPYLNSYGKVCMGDNITPYRNIHMLSLIAGTVSIFNGIVNYGKVENEDLDTKS